MLCAVGRSSADFRVQDRPSRRCGGTGAARSVCGLNQELAREAIFSTEPTQFADSLRTRARLLVQLIDADPLLAGELSLPPEVLARARRIGEDLAAEQNGEWTAMLETAVADDPARGSSRSQWFPWAGGRRLPLHFGYTPHERAGATVRASGLAVARS